MVRILSLALAAMLLVAPLGAGPAVAQSSTPAAEECAPFNIDNARHVRDKLADADTVFEGRVRSVAKVEGPSGDVEFRHSVRVVQVYAGDVDAKEPVRVVTLRPADDGRGRLANRTRFLFFANDRSDSSQLVERCNGTTRLNQPLSDSRAALLDQLVAEAERSARRVAFEEPASGVTEAAPLKSLALPGAILSLLGLLALLAVVAVGARRPH